MPKDIFPSDSEHYPLKNYIILNNEQIKIEEDENWIYAEYTYTNDENDELTIQLPEILSIVRWIVQPDDIEIVSSQRFINNKTYNYVKEGQSPYIQLFTIKNTDDLEQIEFKLVNVDDSDKSYQDIVGIRSLIIHLCK